MQSFKKFFNKSITESAQKHLSEATKDDPHEAMTLAICLAGDDPTITSVFKSDYNDKFKDKLKAYIDNLQEALDSAGEKYVLKYDFKALAQALSAARAILAKYDLKDGAFKEGWMVGNAWPEELQHLQVENDPKYNSSDIVLKKDNLYIGISLKKTDTDTATPTLINNPLNAILAKAKPNADDSDEPLDANQIKLSNKLDKLIELNDEAWAKFFTQLLSSPPFVDSKKSKGYRQDQKSIPKVTPDNWQRVYSALKKLKNIDRDLYKKVETTINQALKNPGTPLKTCHEIVTKNADLFIDTLISTVFKKKLLEKEDFDFAVVTGVGNATVTAFKIEDAHYHELPTVITALDEIIDSGGFKLIQDPKYKNDFDNVLDRSGLKYKLVGKTPDGIIDVLNIDLRFKGIDSYNKPPAFQAFLAKDFIQYLNDK